MLRGFDQAPSKPVLFNWGRKCDFASQGIFINMCRYF